MGCIVPTFQSYMYYYYINIAEFTQFQFSMIRLVSYVTLIVGAVVYNVFLSKSEFRLMLIIACIVNCIGTSMTVLFILNWTFGIDPFVFVMMTNTVTDTLHLCFTSLPLMVLFAKIIPEKIESSMFAFVTGLSALCTMFVSPNLGILYAEILNVNNKNLQ